jgi:hypothetical protein
MDVFDPGLSLSCVIDPQCFFCDLFLPLFSQQARHLGIWQNATWCVAFISQFFIFCFIFFMSMCAYVSCRRSSSCWAVFRFVRYVIGLVVLFVSLTVTHFCPLKLGCGVKFDVSVVCGILLVRCLSQLNVGILVFGWSSHVYLSPP